MFVHKVCELDVLRLQSVRIEVITMPLGVHVHGDPMFSRLIGIMGVAHDCGRVRVDYFWQADSLWQRHRTGTSSGRAIEGVISDPSASRDDCR